VLPQLSVPFAVQLITVPAAPLSIILIVAPYALPLQSSSSSSSLGGTQ
jgi:hypothetical protein